MRKNMYGALERAYGPAARSREGCDWWVVPRDGKRDVHVCLNSPSELVAHVLIFDPDPHNDQFIVDVSARTDPEVQAILKQLSRIVPPMNKDGGKDGHLDGHDGHAGSR